MEQQKQNFTEEEFKIALNNLNKGVRFVSVVEAAAEADTAEYDAWIQLQIEQQAEDQMLYKEWKKDERQELGPLSCDYEYETVERLDKNTVLQICCVCDAERVIEKPKEQ